MPPPFETPIGRRRVSLRSVSASSCGTTTSTSTTISTSGTRSTSTTSSDPYYYEYQLYDSDSSPTSSSTTASSSSSSSSSSKSTSAEDAGLPYHCRTSNCNSGSSIAIDIPPGVPLLGGTKKQNATEPVLPLQSSCSCCIPQKQYQRSSSSYCHSRWVPWSCTLTASLLLHAAGLWQVYHLGSNSALDFLRALLGAAAEGVFVLLLLHRLLLHAVAGPLQWWRKRGCPRATTKTPASSFPSCRCTQWVVTRTAWSALQTLLFLGALVLISVLFVLTVFGDILYRIDSGGLTPTIWVLAAFFLNTRQYMAAKWTATMDEREQQQSSSGNNNGDNNDNEPGASSNDDKIMACVLAGFLVACAVHLLGQYYQWWWRQRQQRRNRKRQREVPPLLGCCGSFYCAVDCTDNKTLLVALVVALLAYGGLGAWSPGIHAFLCWIGHFLFRPGQQYGFDYLSSESAALASSSLLLQRTVAAPNVIYIQHDSLSGSILQKTEQGRRATPFFQSLLEDNDDFYLLEHARAPSGDTRDGMTSLLSGCLPITEAGRKMAFERSLGTEFKRAGYRTFSASSATMNFDQTAWFMLQKHIEGNMDTVVDPLSTGIPVINSEGGDDLALLPYFEEWLRNNAQQQQGEGAAGPPFYAQFYGFNQHFPYVKATNTTYENRYYNSLESFDEYLKRLFQILDKAGQLENTIIVGTGDHGEHPDPKEYIRLKRYNSDVLHTATYMYVPQQLFPSDQSREVLRYNTNQTVSLLDLYPTLQHFLYGGDAPATASRRQANFAADSTSEREQQQCVTGFDLLAAPIPDERLAVSWNKVSNEQSGDHGHFLAALSGKEKALYVKGMNGRADWGFEAFEMDYDQCTERWDADCALELTEERRLHWQEALRDQHLSASLVDGGIRQSQFIKLLRGVLRSLS